MAATLPNCLDPDHGPRKDPCEEHLTDAMLILSYILIKSYNMA
jgi:hypothetical protein